MCVRLSPATGSSLGLREAAGYRGSHAINKKVAGSFRTCTQVALWATFSTSCRPKVIGKERLLLLCFAHNEEAITGMDTTPCITWGT